MKNFKAYVRTTLAASLVLTTGLLTACSGNASSTSTSTAADTTTAANDTTSEKKELKYGKAAGHTPFFSRTPSSRSWKSRATPSPKWISPIFCRTIWH